MGLSHHVVLVLILAAARCVCSQRYYIVPVDSTNLCDAYPSGTCYTLEQFIETSTGEISGGVNLTLTFLPGEHLLTQSVCINNFTEIIMIGQDTPVVRFFGNTSFKFSDIENLILRKLTFTSDDLYTNNIFDCDNNLTSLSVEGFNFFYDCISHNHGALLIRGARNALIENVSFENFPSTAVCISSSHSSVIKNSVFNSNSAAFGGAICITSDNTFITDSNFTNNTAHCAGGAILATLSENMSITNSQFTGNIAEYSGGGIFAQSSHLTTITNSEFANNSASNRGGAIFTTSSHHTSIINSKFTNNKAGNDGGAFNSRSSHYTSIANCEFTNISSADYFGGAIYTTYSHNTSITNTGFINNSAQEGGAINSRYSHDILINSSVFTGNRAQIRGGAVSTIFSNNTSIAHSKFTNNGGTVWGGAFHTIFSSDTTITTSEFSNNIAMEWGGAISTAYSHNVSIANIAFTKNSASEGAAVYIHDCSAEISQSGFTVNFASGNSILYMKRSSVTIVGENHFLKNNGSVYAFDSKLEFHGPTTFSSNKGVTGGAIGALQSQVYFYSKERVIISNNTASYGGGISLTQSTLVAPYSIEILNNTATMSGGGMYAYQSRIEFQSKETIGQSLIANNYAGHNGGGACTVASNVIISNSLVKFDSNTAAANGGGVYLEQNTKLSLLKHMLEYGRTNTKLEVTNNSAQYGGGMYVSDNTTAGVLCGGGNAESTVTTVLSECFLQAIRLHSSQSGDYNQVNTFLENNRASLSGEEIYGGLLDRCTVNPMVERRALNGLDYIKGTVQFSKPIKDIISSDPVSVLFCPPFDQHHDFNLNVIGKKGEAIKVSIIAVDQVGNPVNATIHSSVVTQSGVGRLKEGQAEQKIGSQCTELEYNVYSQDSSAQIQLYAEGPCSNLGISLATVNISFLPCTCPNGFQPSQSPIDCQCECDPALKEHQITNCSYEDGTILLETNTWISIVHTTNGTGYVVHDCPFDYCVNKPVSISLNSSYQIDKQCANNRSGTLCGECEEGLSLVLGTSRCKECSDIFLLLLMPFALAGIALVAFILSLNITMATGTIHGLIFYANILSSNRSIFLPFTTPNVLTIFISWVNLDLGIETCFYDGMNSQAKVLVQLVFPGYLFLLVILIIILSNYFASFSKLLSNRNPVAALCTLILLAYSKLVRMIIAALQYAFLDYPDGSREIVWLYDANVHYFSVSHIPRFVAAAIIITLGGLFTVLLLLGQWLPRCSNYKLLKWTRNTKYNAFIDVYHAPFTPKHRYWMGLLLLTLTVHNIVVAMTTEISYQVFSAGCVSLGLIMVKMLSKKIYKNRLHDSLETLFLLNLVTLAFGTVSLKQDSQQGLANTSMAISFVLFLVIVCYHFYEYSLKKTRLWMKLTIEFRNWPLLACFQRQGPAQNRHEVKEPCIHDRNIEPGRDAFFNNGQEFTIAPPYTDSTRAETQQYLTPPIIRPAVDYGRLREPDLDILAPLNTNDYRVVPPPNIPDRPIVTCTVIEPIAKSDNPPEHPLNCMV